MSNKTQIQIIEALANGINPLTGDNLETDAVYNHPEVIRALFTALRILEQSQIPPKNADKSKDKFYLSMQESRGVVLRILNLVKNLTKGFHYQSWQLSTIALMAQFIRDL
jgi:hypothetical protein